MFIWVALNENVNQAKILWVMTGVYWNQGFLPELAETKATVKPDAETISSWYHDMEGHDKKCVERYCELANITTQQLYKVVTPCIDDHQFKGEEIRSVGDLSKVCSHIVLKFLHLARIGRFDILWSVNIFARAVTKWTKACDKRLARLISSSTVQIRIQNSDFAEDLEDSKSISGGLLCIFGSQTFVPVSRMCKKQNISPTQRNRA